MNYIINPSWFYWLGVANAAKIVSFVISMIAAIGLIIGLSLMMANIEYGPDDKDYKNGVRIAKVCGIVAVVAALAAVFIPSKKTIIEMMVAKFATYENARLTIDAVKNAVDHIISAVKGG